jgi:hypothetical protein
MTLDDDCVTGITSTLDLSDLPLQLIRPPVSRLPQAHFNDHLPFLIMSTKLALKLDSSSATDTQFSNGRGSQWSVNR